MISLLTTAASYAGIASLLEQLYDSAKQKFGSTEIEKLHRKAVRQWANNDAVRKDRAKRVFSDFQHMINHYTGKDIPITSGDKELVEILTNEFLSECSVAERVSLEQNISIIESLENLQQQISLLIEKSNGKSSENRIQRFSDPNPNLNDIKYVGRTITCYNGVDPTNFSDYYQNKKNIRTAPLIDFITNEQSVADNSNHFVLYGKAQFGKTTELIHLAHALNETKDYVAYLVRLREYPGITVDDFICEPIVDGKRAVVIVDAVDEVESSNINKFVRALDGYSRSNPHLKILVSCRANFKENGSLSNYTSLMLNDLSYEEANQLVLKNSGPEYLVNKLEDLNLYEFAVSPFFLKTSVVFYQEKGLLPSKKVDLLHFFIEESLKEEKVFANSNSELKKAYGTLQELAVIMQLSGNNSLSLDYVDAYDNFSLIRRSRIIAIKDDDFSFSQTAFKEYYVALFLREKSIDTVKELITYNDTEIVVPDWYNTVLLYAELLYQSDACLASEFVEWLNLHNSEMIPFLDTKYFEPQLRTKIVIDFYEKCKQNNVSISSYHYTMAKLLMSFGNTDEVAKFLVDEICEAKSLNFYINSVLESLQYVDIRTINYNRGGWNLSERMVEAVFKLVEIDLANDDDNRIIYDVFDNQVFYNSENFERMSTLVDGSTNVDLIRAFLKILKALGEIDVHIDLVLCVSHKINRHAHAYYYEQIEGPLSTMVSLFSDLQTYEAWLKVYRVISEEYEESHHAYNEGLYDLKIDELLFKILPRLVDDSDVDRILDQVLNIAANHKKWPNSYCYFEVERANHISCMIHSLSGNSKMLYNELLKLQKVMSQGGADSEITYQSNRVYFLISTTNVDDILEWCQNGEISREVLTHLAYVLSDAVAIRFKEFLGMIQAEENDKINFDRWELKHFESLFSINDFSESIRSISNKQQFENLAEVYKYFRKVGNEENQFLREFYTIFLPKNKEKLDLDKICTAARDKEIVLQYALMHYINRFKGDNSNNLSISESHLKLLHKKSIELVRAQLSGQCVTTYFRCTHNSFELLIRDNLPLDSNSLVSMLPISYQTSYIDRKSVSLFDFILSNLKAELLHRELMNIFEKNINVDSLNIEVWAKYIFTKKVDYLITPFLGYVENLYQQEQRRIISLIYNLFKSEGYIYVKKWMRNSNINDRIQYVYIFDAVNQDDNLNWVLSLDLEEYGNNNFLLFLLIELADSRVIDYLLRNKEQLQGIRYVSFEKYGSEQCTKLFELFSYLEGFDHKDSPRVKDSLMDYFLNIVRQSKSEYSRIKTMFENFEMNNPALKERLYWRLVALRRAYLENNKGLYSFEEAEKMIANS